MKSVEKQRSGNLNVDEADRLLEALETVTQGTLAAWAQKLSAPRMMALLNATASDDETELVESIVTQADFEAMVTPSRPTCGAPRTLQPNPTPTRSLRRVARLL